MSNATVIIFVTPNSNDNLDRLHKFLDEYYEVGYEFEAANSGMVTKARLVSINDASLPNLWYNSRHIWNIDGIYIGAFEGLNEADFITFVRTVDWEEPEYVQVFIRSSRDWKNGFRFEEIALFNTQND